MMGKVGAWLRLSLGIIFGVVLSAIGQWLMNFGMGSSATVWPGLVVAGGAIVLGGSAVVAPQVATNKVPPRDDRWFYFLMRLLLAAVTVLAGSGLLGIVPHFKDAAAGDWVIMMALVTVLIGVVLLMFWSLQKSLASNAVVNESASSSSGTPSVGPRQGGHGWMLAIGIGVGWVIHWMVGDHRDLTASVNRDR